MAQAKLAFVAHALRIAEQFNGKLFASIITDPNREYNPNVLRKDYSYLFQRFFYFLEDFDQDSIGVVVFDELERNKSHILVEQLARYFEKTHTGSQRAARIIPEPFFVHSELTTGVQLADLAAYILSWGFRNAKLLKPSRNELEYYVRRLIRLRYDCEREGTGVSGPIHGIAIIPDLQSRYEKLKKGNAHSGQSLRP